MALSKLLSIAIAIIYLPYFSHAKYSSSSNSNLVLYWGQGANQQRLLHFCEQSTVDIIVIGFVDVFPTKVNGFPGTNFGNQCSGAVYPGSSLLSQCPSIVEDIPKCQSQYGKKIILSLGGGSNGYNLTGASDGEYFADFLWGAFGPRTQTWVRNGLPRPFDGPGNQAVQVDGFDFDIEIPSTDKEAGYIELIQRLRSHFSSALKPYYITGAPQCVVPDANMGTMISKAQFDLLFIQFYNTPSCSARNWAHANPTYVSSKVEKSSGFSYNEWAAFLVGTASSNAKIYIGIPGSTKDVVDATNYLAPVEVANLVDAYIGKHNFGGIMIWEATGAENNIVSGQTYYQMVKSILLEYKSASKRSMKPHLNRARNAHWGH